MANSTQSFYLKCNEIEIDILPKKKERRFIEYKTINSPPVIRTQTPISKKVTYFLSKILKLLERERKFFQHSGDIHGFMSYLSQYKCHMCNSVLSAKRPSDFISQILTHVRRCRKRHQKNSAESTFVGDIEFDKLFTSMLETSKFIIKSSTLLETRGSKDWHFCKDCNWSGQVNRIKTKDKLFKTLLQHLKTKHCDIANSSTDIDFGPLDKIDNFKRENKKRGLAECLCDSLPYESNSGVTSLPKFVYSEVEKLKEDSVFEIDSGEMTIEEKVISHVNEFLNLIQAEKTFFTHKGNINGFGPSFEEYKCHQCSSTIESCETPNIFIESIASHDRHCCPEGLQLTSQLETLSLTENVTVSDSEFDYIYSCMLKKFSLIKETFNFIPNGNIYCCLRCIWKSKLTERDSTQLVVTMLINHLITNHSKSFAVQNFEVPKHESTEILPNLTKSSVEKETSKKEIEIYKDDVFVNFDHHLCDLQQVDSEIEQKVSQYLNLLLQCIEINRNFFTEVGRLDGLEPNLTKYQCHFCHKSVPSRNEMPTVFMSMIFAHVQTCRLRYIDRFGEEAANSVNLSDIKYSQVYNSILTTFELIRDSFTFLKTFRGAGGVLCCCRKCSWQDVQSYTAKPGQVVKILQVHLQCEHIDGPFQHRSSQLLKSCDDNSIVESDLDWEDDKVTSECYGKTVGTLLSKSGNITQSNRVLGKSKDLHSSVHPKKKKKNKKKKANEIGRHFDLLVDKGGDKNTCTNLSASDEKVIASKQDYKDVFVKGKKITSKSKTIKCEAEIKVSKYLDEFLNNILKERTFFMNERRIDCFEENFKGYQCNFCLSWIPLNKRSAGRFISKILVHVKQCKENKEKAKKNRIKEKSNIDEMRFHTFLNSIIRNCERIKESFGLLEEINKETTFSCKVCGWNCSLNCDTGAGQLIQDLQLHLRTRHFDDSINHSKNRNHTFKDSNIDQNVHPQTELSNFKSKMDKDNLKTKAIVYLNELLVMIKENRTLFTEVGSIIGFRFNFDYQCHLCNEVVSLHRTDPSIFKSNILEHVLSCRSAKLTKDIKNNVENTNNSDIEFDNIYSAMLRKKTLVKDSFQFLEKKNCDGSVYTCQECNWQRKLSCQMNAAELIKRLLLHLETKHFLS